jgi:chromosome segregation ATPase
LDLERTDRLPVLDGSMLDHQDVQEDGAARMDVTTVVPSHKAEFQRPSGVDLPSLAESVRTVEDRIARQQADYEALNRSFEKSRETESAALARAESLAADLARLRAQSEAELARARAQLEAEQARGRAQIESEQARARAQLEAEQARLRETGKKLEDTEKGAETARGKMDEALREAQRHLAEARTLRETLAARDATIVQVLHSLGERDTQLSSLQREHAQLVPALGEKAQTATRLESDLKDSRTLAASLASELASAQQSVAGLTVRLKNQQAEFDGLRRESHGWKSQASTYLEQLRSREWRRGFDDNLFRELDAKAGSALLGESALKAERDRVVAQLRDLESRLAEREESIAALKAAAADGEAQRASDDVKLKQTETARAELLAQVAALETEQSRLNAELAAREQSIAGMKAVATSEAAARDAQELKLQRVERVCAELTDRLATLESERSRLNDEVAKRDAAVAEALSSKAAEARRGQEAMAAAEQSRVALTAEVDRLKAAARAQEDEMAVLIAHLHEARRPIETIEAEVARLTSELTAKSAAIDQLNEDNRAVRAALERTRGALEEREFLIRRLERSESNAANVLGRIQTSIERLGGANAAGASAAVECSAELIRVDGNRNTAHPLGRRTRIGRAPGCEMQIESSSVSRHHCLVLMSTRDVIIEDLNSTNGVLVNGRKVSRQFLSDGDLLTIGEAQFRLSIKLTPRTLEAPPAPATAETT